MTQDTLDALFSLAGACMLTCLFSGFLVRRMIAGESALAEELFDRPLAASSRSTPTLLRARLFLPWVPIQHLYGQATSTVLLVWLCRLSGTAFILAIAAFLAGVFLATGA